MGDDRIIKLGSDMDQIKGSVHQIDTKLDKLEDKVNDSIIEIKEHIASEAVSDKQIFEQLNRNNSLLEQYNGSLIKHMHRTDLNEERLEELKKINVKMEERLYKVEVDLLNRKAVKRFFITTAKVVGYLSGATGVIAGVYKIAIFLADKI